MAKKPKNEETQFSIGQTFSYGVIYVYSIPLESHVGRLKIGSATLNAENPTQSLMDLVASDRIEDQTKTADIPFKLEHVELAVTDTRSFFSDHDVHQVLIRSGYERKSENVQNTHSEWFEISLDVAKNAIKAVKEGRTALLAHEINQYTPTISFRPNQLEAITKTSQAIEKGRKHFLWNAKMRFGKTAAAMQVAKNNQMKTVLIVTHRPSVSDDWFTDFKKVFSGTDYEYSSKTLGENISTRLKNKKPFFYFASLQDLRLSKRVVGDENVKSQSEGFDKNDEVFDNIWDMLIVDEAHEGTQSNLGDATLNKIKSNFKLELSGTPFNILHKREEEDIYTWDYVMEQMAKREWDQLNPGSPNPYAELPELKIFTYDIDDYKSHIGSLGDNFLDKLDGAFKFSEFFRVHKDEHGNDTAQFVYESMVKKFLDLLVDDTLNTKFPYATEAYRNFNKHSLWLLPNRTKVIEALEKLLKEHPIFGHGQFGIVNISGDDKDDAEDADAKNRVTQAIKAHEYTITLTGQRLTTGASIPEWTAVFMMSDTTSTTTYLQTAFRCQTPAKINGKMKTQGYVFDFAPDRTLKLIAEAIELNHKSGKTNTPEQKEAMREFLNFCPIIAAASGRMRLYDVDHMLSQLKKAVIERVRRNGFDDPKLYNDELLRLDDIDITQFNKLQAIVGKSTNERVNEIEINSLGLDKIELERAEKLEQKKKQKKELSSEEKEALKKLKEARDQRKNAMSILRAVSIRMPMLVYGSSLSLHDDLTLKKFIEDVDDESWQEFMPAGLSKQMFEGFVKYYDEDVFKGVTKSIRARAFDCDDLMPTERVQAIAEIFATFKNPDKETVLTPWDVVNMHITAAFGGHDFRGGIIDKTGKPEWKGSNNTNDVWSQDDARVLEINSKSGLYPLLAAYNFYTRRLKNQHKSEEKIHHEVWSKVLSENIYVLCKSPMARSITQRTLAGYKHIKTNVIYIHDLVSKLQNKDPYHDYKFYDDLKNLFNFKRDMKFTAIIGNPPYNEKISENVANRSLSKQLFPVFIVQSIKLSPDYVSLITPSRWFKGEAQDGSFPRLRDYVKKNNHFTKIVHYPRGSDVFPGIVIKGGVSYFVWKKDYSGDVEFINIDKGQAYSMARPLFENGLDVILDENESIAILNKVLNHNHTSLTTITQGRNAFGIVGKKTELDKLTQSKKFTGAVQVHCMNNEIRYIKKSNIKKNFDIMESWKVFISKSAGDPATDSKIISSPFIGHPGSVCTDTFIPIGKFNNKLEANSLMSYLKTKFLRYMVSVMKVSQNVSQIVYNFVPMQDFSSNSDIDWSKSVPEIDEQLYKKYSLSKNEIDFIEKHVKAMS